MRKTLFLERLAGIFDSSNNKDLTKGELKLFLTPGTHSSRNDGPTTGNQKEEQINGFNLPFLRRRITVDDIAEVIGDDKRSAVVYLCGLPTMTDDFVDKLTSADGLGLEPHRVLYEKWW